MLQNCTVQNQCHQCQCKLRHKMLQPPIPVYCLCKCQIILHWLLFVLQAAPMWVNSSPQASCQWYHGDVRVSNTPTTKPILTWWRRSMPSLINQVLLSTTFWSNASVQLLSYLATVLVMAVFLIRFHRSPDATVRLLSIRKKYIIGQVPCELICMCALTTRTEFISLLQFVRK